MHATKCILLKNKVLAAWAQKSAVQHLHVQQPDESRRGLVTLCATWLESLVTFSNLKMD